MYEQVLVPLDGSELAEVAIPYAEELGRRLDSRLVLLAVCESSQREQNQEYLDRIAESLCQNGDKSRLMQVATAIREGDNPPEEIIAYADENEIDLTMMATHGRSGISRWAMGSVADKVVRGTCQPIILIRAKGSQSDVHPDCLISRIFAPLDGSEAGEAALPYIEEMALKIDAEVILFETVAKQDFAGEVDSLELRKLTKLYSSTYLKGVEQRLINKGISVRCEIRFEGNPPRQIIDLATQTGSAVIAMSTHGRSGVDRWVFGSVADKVLRAGDTPVLLVRSPGACSAALRDRYRF